jgi:hypothetical protein
MIVAKQSHLSPGAVTFYAIIDRLICNQEVEGSIPFVSINSSALTSGI